MVDNFRRPERWLAALLALALLILLPLAAWMVHRADKAGWNPPYHPAAR